MDERLTDEWCWIYAHPEARKVGTHKFISAMAYCSDADSVVVVIEPSRGS